MVSMSEECVFEVKGGAAASSAPRRRVTLMGGAQGTKGGVQGQENDASRLVGRPGGWDQRMQGGVEGT